jgi:hypothetical protein
MNDFQPELPVVLRASKCEDGDLRATAVRDLEQAEALGLLRLERHRRDPDIILKVRVPLANEPALFAYIGEDTPTQMRRTLARQFNDAAIVAVPEKWRGSWRTFCQRRHDAALCGDAIAPFDRTDLAANAELLALLPKLLKWGAEPDETRRTSLVRFSSCVLLGNSKRLEELAAQEKDGQLRNKLRGKLGRLLEEITGGEVRTLDDLGILPNPRFALVHGPLRLLLGGQWLNLGLLQGPFRLSLEDTVRADAIETTACRCLTVENETSFHELAKLRSGELLVQTSFPGSGTLALLKRLPITLEFWHFGDSDEPGFEILRDLRERTGHDFHPLHMERGRKNFEQESLGRPTLAAWPFYRCET